jgi:hypothetical protein
MPSDEKYVIDLWDEVLGKKALRQHRFDFLRGGSRTAKPGRLLPVDPFYCELSLVVEYRERQHGEPVAIMDRRDTVSGCKRGEQRRIYDDRRRTELKSHGVRLLELTTACSVTIRGSDCSGIASGTYRSFSQG